MSIDEEISQDPLDSFTKSVIKGRIDWQTYFQGIRADQKADADQLLREFQVITPTQSGKHSVVISRTGIHQDFSLPVIDGITANYNIESTAKLLTDYLNSIQSTPGKQVVQATYRKNP